MNYKIFSKVFLTTVLLMSFAVACLIAYIDPCFHYHKPNPQFYYTLLPKQQRYQNDGILKHFEYNAIITGTSMTENFKTKEFNSLFKVKSIKIPFSGGTFKEINDAIKVAYNSGHNVKTVIRALDYYNLRRDKDAMRTDLGQYPEYLYNDNPFDDVKYLLNKDILFKYCVPTLKKKINNKPGGITSFNTYSNWNKYHKFGREYVVKKLNKKYYINNKIVYNVKKKQKAFTKKDEKLVEDNIIQNVTSLAKEHPETTFYYFFPPYSIVYYVRLINDGEIERHLSAEKMAIELMLECPNIKIFSFNLMTDITTNLDNYKDLTHYGEKINSRILEMMKSDEGRITKENYKNYLEKERELFFKYPYEEI